MKPSKTARELMKIGSSTLSDALGKGGAMDHDMKCWSAKARMAGPAFTVRVHPADILMIAQAMAECPAGSVLVIDGQGELNTAIWGELTTLSMQLKGAAGVVIDGAIRDWGRIRKSPLAVFARAAVPNGGGAEYLGEIGVAVSCGGQVVNPGDWLVGDDDGVVVIPASKLEAAMELGRRIVAAEKVIEKQIRAGKEIAELIGTAAAIERKRAGVLIPQLRGPGGQAK